VTASGFYKPCHFAYINNCYNIELGHKSHDQCLIRNIKHWGTGRKVLIVDCCIAHTKIKSLKCKVVKLPHFSLKLIELYQVSYWGRIPSPKLPHLFIFKFVIKVFNVMLREGGSALYKQCFKHLPFQHSVCVCFH